MNIVTLFLALSILVAIILICFSDRKKVKQFDERQLIVRGRAVNLAYVTLLICLFIVLALSTMNLPWLDVPVCVILSMFISLTIFSVYAILNNAYFTNFKKESPSAAYSFPSPCSICSTVSVISSTELLRTALISFFPLPSAYWV